MDIRDLGVEETTVLPLVNAKDEPAVDEHGKPLTVTLYGPSSKQYRSATLTSNNRAISKLRKKGNSEHTAEELLKDQEELVIACTKEFSANVQHGDKAGVDLVRAIYTDPNLGFITEHVAKHLKDWGNFTKGSPTA